MGMLPKTVTEEQLRAVFEPFGSLLEAAILKGVGNVSKGRSCHPGRCVLGLHTLGKPDRAYLLCSTAR